MKRRHFMGSVSAAAGALGLGADAAAATAAATPASARPGAELEWMLGLLQRMAEPVLAAMARGELKKRFPLELSPTWDGRSPNVAYLECFGRLISGIAPWLP